MTPAQRDSRFRERILDAYEKLPQQQRRVADYFLEHLAEVPFLGVPELAGKARVSEATVVRFAQRIGYEGFAELKTALLRALRDRVIRPAESAAIPEALARAPEDDVLAAVARQEISNIEHAARNLDREKFASAAAALFKADHVYTFGLGISSHLAGMLSYLLTQIGIRASTLHPGFSSPLEATVPLRLSDLLVVLSYPPYSRKTLEMLQVTTENGIPTLAITDRETSPAATAARHALPIRSDNMMYTNSFAGISVLLNALVTEIALRNRDHAVDAVSRITRILDEDDGLIGGKG